MGSPHQTRKNVSDGVDVGSIPTWEVVVKVGIICEVMGVHHAILNKYMIIWVHYPLGIVGHQLIALHGKEFTTIGVKGQVVGTKALATILH